MYEGLKRAWLCDPDKNKECRKTSCFINGGPCRCTGNVSYRLESEKSDTYDRVANIIDELNDIAFPYLKDSDARALMGCEVRILDEVAEK